MHRFYLIALTLVFTFFAGLLHAEEQDEPKVKVDRYELKEAQLWVKDQLAVAKKATAALKKIKDEKSAEKSLKAFKKILPSTGGTQTALGTTGAPKAPEGAAIEQVREKSASKIEKAGEALDAQIERIRELEIGNSELDAVLDQLDKMEF